MTTLRRSFTVPVPPDQVAGYLSDLRTSPDWDPHTIDCLALDDGPVRVGSRYQHTREFGGRSVTVEMTVVDFEAGRRVVWSGQHRYADGREEFRFSPHGADGTVVEHGVDVTLRGVARVGEPMVPGVMRRIADDGASTLRERLEAL